jgi:hypothetical protein
MDSRELRGLSEKALISPSEISVSIAQGVNAAIRLWPGCLSGRAAHVALPARFADLVLLATAQVSVIAYTR